MHYSSSAYHALSFFTLLSGSRYSLLIGQFAADNRAPTRKAGTRRRGSVSQLVKGPECPATPHFRVARPRGILASIVLEGTLVPCA